MAAALCYDTGFQKLILEGDALQVVNNLTNNVKDWSQAGILLEDTRKLLDFYAFWCAKSIERYANKAAHYLAKNALSLLENLVYVEEIPNCIQSIVLIEFL